MFDPGHNYNDEPDDGEEPECFGVMSFKNLQQEALQLFGKFVQKVSGANIPDRPPDNAEKYLTLAEVEGIIREHGEEFPHGFVVGGDTEEEARHNMGRLMAALMERILSNLMAAGVKDGHLDCSFDAETDDFEFTITEKGKQFNATCRNKEAERN
jgi:hypothetical protein